MTLAIYAGSFDPFTRGHADIVEKAARVFDEIVIGIGQNPRKKRLFPIEQSIELIEQSCQLRSNFGLKRLTVIPFDGALVDFAHVESADAIVRGLRQVSDFNDEFTQHGVNSRLTDIPMVYFICKERYLHVSSSTAKELVTYDKPVEWLVDSHVESALRAALRE